MAVSKKYLKKQLKQVKRENRELKGMIKPETISNIKKENKKLKTGLIILVIVLIGLITTQYLTRF